MFQLDSENQRRITDPDKEEGPAKQPKRGRRSGPDFAPQRNAPWDPLADEPLPWGDKIEDPLASNAMSQALGSMNARDSLGAEARLGGKSPLLAWVPTARLGELHSGPLSVQHEWDEQEE
ncbi:MAG: hypothetical protein RMK29_07585 [Myxococcales bacterium]|nr:hypothetical protein [Myxococcota bacterium]MDW8281556.1 hypothetical protein [Myxococcales bacterium]